MRATFITCAVLLLLIDLSMPGRAQTRQRLNPVIGLLEHSQPVFGVYWPANGGGRRGGDPPPARPPLDLAKDALAYRATDFLFSGSMEGGVDRGMPAYVAFANALVEAAGPSKAPYFGLKHPLIVKTPKIATDAAKAIDNISRELNVGASGV